MGAYLDNRFIRGVNCAPQKGVSLRLLKPRILCIDDEPSISEMVRVVFEETGDFIVEAETDAFSALARAKRFQPDVILFDISMPGPDGYDIARQIRAEPGLRHRPILFHSGMTGCEEAALKAGRGGPTDFIQKGLPIRALETAVRSIAAERLERYETEKAVRLKAAAGAQKGEGV
jgi:CheY-like chemotaxis protein